MDRHLYFCPPDYLDLIYVINPFMDLKNVFSRDKAKLQHAALIEEFRKVVGPENITVAPAKEGLTELCFFGDSVFAIDDKVLFGRFFHKERFPETEYVIEFLKSRKLVGTRVPENISFEGSGETMLWNGKIFTGYGKRNNSDIVKFLKEYYQRETIGFELTDPRFYHLDTCLCPLTNNLIAVYYDVFTEEGKKKLDSLGCELLKVS